MSASEGTDSHTQMSRGIVMHPPPKTTTLQPLKKHLSVFTTGWSVLPVVATPKDPSLRPRGPLVLATCTGGTIPAFPVQLRSVGAGPATSTDSLAV